MKALCIFSGPSCSGKSWAVSALQEGRLQDLAARMDLGDLREWTICPARAFSACAEDARVLLHHDSLGQWLTYGSFDNLSCRLSLIRQTADKASAVTFVAPPDVLLKRWTTRQRRLLYSPWLLVFRARWRMLLACRRVAKIYRQPEKLLEHYARWFEFSGSLNVHPHIVADFSRPSPIMLPATEWRSLLPTGKIPP